MEELDPEITAAIARRPAGLRLPHNGARFRALRDVTVDLLTLFRLSHLSFDLPIDVRQAVVASGEVLWLDYEPDPSASTHCCVMPERYEELERSLIDARFTTAPEYTGYRFSISYVQLDTDFEWLSENE